MLLLNFAPIVRELKPFDTFFSFYPNGLRGIILDHFKHHCTYYVSSPMKDSLGLSVDGAYEWDEVAERKVIEHYGHSVEYRANAYAYPSIDPEQTIEFVTTKLVTMFEEHFCTELDHYTHTTLDHAKMDWYTDAFIGIPLIKGAYVPLPRCHRGI